MITLEQVKTELGTLSADNDDLIDWLIDSVISIWEDKTDKTWSEQNIIETFTNAECGQIYLKSEKLIRINYVAQGSDSALAIGAADGKGNPTVAIDETTLTLITIDDEISITLADFPTLSDLACEINTNDGWTAFAYPGHTFTKSKMLIAVSGVFAETTGTEFNVPDELVSDFKLDIKLRLLEIPNTMFPVMVSYKGGYTTSTAPAWLRQVLIRQVCHWYKQAIEKRWNVSSITLGDGGTINYGEQRGNLLSDFVIAAGKHKRITI